MTTINISTRQPTAQELRDIFSERSFAFADGKLKSTGQPRAMGIAEGCSLEIVGEPAIAWATMVAIMAPDDEKLAKLNGLRLSALMGVLMGQAGVKWIGRMLTEANKHRRAGRVKIGDSLLGWRLALVVNFQKSTITLKVQKGRSK